MDRNYLNVAEREHRQWIWVGYALTACLAVVCIFFLFIAETPTEKAIKVSKEKRDQERILEQKTKIAIWAIEERALRSCQAAIKASSRDPATAKVPDTARMSEGVDMRFAWIGERQVRMRNGIGLEVSTPAICVVDEKTIRIKMLLVDGQHLV